MRSPSRRETTIPQARTRARPRTSAQAFLYAHLAEALQRRIVNGVYPAGSPIPSETELVAEFGVSAITVRRAIRELTFEGMLFGRQGRGVFVADRRRIVRVLSRDSRTSIGDEIRRAGLQPGIKELDWSTVRDPVLARRLGLPAQAALARHEKLILADAEPVSLDVVYLPRELGERLRPRLAEDFVFPLLARHGIPVARTDFQFEGGAASAEHAAILGLPLRAPLILVHYTLYARAGAAVLTGVTIARSDRFTFALALENLPRERRRSGRRAGAAR
ncbi:MAG TPA: GntR family transcriptional regulator [Methylomirabilota bacterium]|nr:GntR family transcriptional regulator [Methylomirabilota bacterium]